MILQNVCSLQRILVLLTTMYRSLNFLQKETHLSLQRLSIFFNLQQ